MKFDVYSQSGKKLSAQIELKNNVFKIQPNEHSVYLAVKSELAAKRQGTHSSKTKGEVAGTGAKPWRQKGTGRARAGTIRSPLWKGGGTVFGPEPHDYNHKLPKRLSKLARCSILSTKASEGNILVVEDFAIVSHKTSEFIAIIDSLDLKNKKLTVLVSEYNENLDKSVRNLKNVYLIDSKKASSYDLIDCDVLLIDKASIEILTEMLS